MATLDTEVLIIGAGVSGLGLAVQLIRKYGLRDFQILEKAQEVGGTWQANTYPGCGCDVPSHFYSYSFELNSDWSQKFSMQSEIQAYFRGVAEKYNITPHIRFSSVVEKASWDESSQSWEVVFTDYTTKQTHTKRSRFLVSAVGSLSVPRQCEIPGAADFGGPLFHSATWDHSFDWKDRDVVVIGNGCSATQFVPVIAESAHRLTQFGRSAHFLAERPNPVYTPTFKAIMKYMPFAMRLYRLKLYADMEKDFAGFDIQTGSNIRQGLKEENERYVKRMAPQKYWNAVIPNHEIGCKRKVMDTGYLSCLHRDNVELVHDDPVEEITKHGVRTRNGREVNADAIVLATGFSVFRMLFPMEIYGQHGIALNEHWNEHHQGAAQAYLGTCTPGFPNFFTLMGPNTVTGHLSVIYTIECQINFVLRLMDPILKSNPRRSILPRSSVNAVEVKSSAALRDSSWTQAKLKQLVWSSGCTNWALDPKTGLNIAMYPDYQYLFWLRSVFIHSDDFDYADSKTKEYKTILIGGWKSMQQFVSSLAAVGMLTGALLAVRQSGALKGYDDVIVNALGTVPSRASRLLRR